MRDVTNPLCGPMGSSGTTARKSGQPRMVKELDEALLHYAELSKETLDRPPLPRYGAAGVSGFGVSFHTNAVLEELRLSFEEQMKDADFVITGEGR